MPEWTWDPDKDALNIRRHGGLSLADGVPVLTGDPLAASRPDPHPDGDRWQTIGSAGGVLILFVVHTDLVRQANGREIGRIISVRRATAHEQKAYEQGTF
ncbi:MAG: BrnT family toxin [Rhodospirillales bacterium]|nr:BrnT family toxin [Rhodospirillales bacterium]MBN8928145.1 BrnT family toxin [Rhodospirillales bacterium]